MITCHRNAPRAENIAKEIEALGGRCSYRKVNLANSGEVDELFETAAALHGHIGHTIYAAGPHFDFNFIGSIPSSEWHQVIDTDVHGAFHVIQNAVRAYRGHGKGGTLVAVITAAVERVPVKDILSAAPKAAIEMLIRGVAKEAGRFGIRANCVGPGWIDVGIGKRGLEEQLDAKARETIRMQTIPMRRFGDADDIANAVLFLCSEQAGYVTGQSLAVDGGLQL
jgi:NAD(P)-dependent dehydrogenase (short-subunit alcohol dehydrogenase family)